MIQFQGRLVVLAIVLVCGVCLTQCAIVGNDDLGCAFDMDWYADPNGIMSYLPRVFKAPNTNDKCLGMGVSSDITCQSIKTTLGQKSDVSSGKEQSQERSKKSGFSADFLGFSSSVSHESVSSYFSNMCFGLASEYDQHNYYSLKLNWKHRGLTSGFINDIKSLAPCALTKKYGNYFLVEGIFGGSYSYSQSSSYSYLSSQNAQQTSISEGYDNFTNSNSWGKNQTGSNTFSQSEAKFYAKGGDYECLQGGATCSWVDSCESDPVIVDFQSGTTPLISLGDILTAYGYTNQAGGVQTCNDEYIGNLTDNKFVSLSSTSATIPLILMSANDCKDDAGTSGYTYVDCDVKSSDYFLASVTMGYYDSSTTKKDGYSIAYLSCVFEPFAVDDPSGQNSYSKTIQSGKGGNNFVTAPELPGYAIIGYSFLIPEGKQCTSDKEDVFAIGMRFYYGAISPISKPYVGAISSHLTEDIYFGTDTSVTQCATATKPNTIITHMGIESFLDRNHGSNRYCNQFKSFVGTVDQIPA